MNIKFIRKIKEYFNKTVENEWVLLKYTLLHPFPVAVYVSKTDEHGRYVTDRGTYHPSMCLRIPGGDKLEPLTKENIRLYLRSSGRSYDAAVIDLQQSIDEYLKK